MAIEAGVQSDPDHQAVPKLPLLSVLAFSFLIRLFHLNYNGPFIDESFHSIVVDYGNVPFLTGDVYLYPQLSYFVHAHAGLVGARFMSAVFGTLTVGCVYKTAEIVSHRFVPAGKAPRVALFAAFVFSLSAPALFVSQFANYYALAFMLFAFGLWQTLRGIAQNRPGSLAVGAAALVVAFATRYLVLGYLPVVLLYVAVRSTASNGQRASTKYFWVPFAVSFVAYSGWSHEHLLGALQHAQRSGTGLALEPTLRLRLLVLAEGLGRTAPVMILACVGSIAYARRALLAGNTQRRRQLFDLAWLAIGSLWMVLYHCTFAHDLTMESNLTLAVNFAAVPAGLGVHYLVTYTLAVRRRALALSLAAALAAASAAGAFHTVSILRDDRTWPDWRPVVAAAHEQGVASARSIWSTADNGGMRNTWGVRRAAPQLAGNVWQLRSEFGSAVDVGSPWVRWETVELLQLAARREIDFVIGPLPFRNLRVNERVHGFIVAAIVHVPNGEACYVLRNARSGM